MQAAARFVPGSEVGPRARALASGTRCGLPGAGFGWCGRAALALGLSGAADADALADAAAWRFPEPHAPAVAAGMPPRGPLSAAAWEIVLAAPTSVSFAALAEGDKSLLCAHLEAVAEAIAHFEARARGASARTAKLLCARLAHDVGEQLEPRLHDHVIVFDVTLGARGAEPLRADFVAAHHRSLAIAYAMSLESRVRALGIETTTTGRGDWEIARVSFELVSRFRAGAFQVERRIAAERPGGATAGGARPTLSRSEVSKTWARRLAAARAAYDAAGGDDDALGEVPADFDE